jgi:hypothetical protein
MDSCKHINLKAEIVDQTAGVLCTDCNTLLATCWDDHIPESLWNRTCKSDPELKPCKQNRDNVCAICSEEF